MDTNQTPIENKKGRRGQAMTEFVIALPFLLLVLFGIFEFGRLIFAWMAVQNAARFGLRYAVTGEYKEEYCDEAGNYLGATYVNADTYDGDPQDCQIPDSYTGVDPREKEKDLIDVARLFSIRDAALGGGTGLWLREVVSGDYEQYLLHHDQSYIGSPTEKGYYHVTVCSNRDNHYAMDHLNYDIPLCVDNFNGILMDDAGGPGDRVKVHVEYRHSLLFPFLTEMWSSLMLNAERDGIVEQFRTSRVAGVSGPIQSAPTWTQTPTITPTPTKTPTPLPTPTFTPVPTAFTCNGSGILREYWLGISGNNLGNLTGHSMYPSAPDGNSIEGSFDAPVNWNDSYGTRMRAWLCLPRPGHYVFWISSDDDSKLLLDCSGTDPLTPGDANPAAASQIAYVDGWTHHMQFDKYSSQQVSFSISKAGWVCYIEALQKEGWGGDSLTVAWQPPHTGSRSVISGEYLMPLAAQPTALPTDTPTITPTPDCSKYEMSEFSFSKWAMMELTIENGDIVDTKISRIQLDWDFAEAFGEANGYPNLNLDWIKKNGSEIWGDGNGDGVRDLGSWTDTSSDCASSWDGPQPFNAGGSYELQFDFDDDWGGGGALSNLTSSDFGIIIDFTNGCQLSRSAAPQPLITWTPTNTPTITPTNPPPTATPLPSDTPTASNTPLPTNTPTASNTPLPPTATFTPSNTPTASNTPVATNTPFPTSTNTPGPPTNTPTPEPSATPTPTYFLDT
ncbi:MAG: TadE/TadG family type IV pilus assembly protein [Anaerolineales bacterium]